MSIEHLQMIRWWPNTCHCIIEFPHGKTPDDGGGTFIQRCKVHKNSRDTIEAFEYNRANRTRDSETEETADTRKRRVRDATR